MARIESMTLNLDLRKKEDLDLYNKAMDDARVTYQNNKYVVHSVTIHSVDGDKVELVLFASEA